MALTRRDPRIDPQPGDLIVQRPSGMRLRVTGRNGDEVSWAWQKYACILAQHNSWNIKGWRNMVASGAAVLETADAAQLGEARTACGDEASVANEFSAEVSK